MRFDVKVRTFPSRHNIYILYSTQYPPPNDQINALFNYVASETIKFYGYKMISSRLELDLGLPMY